MANQDPHAKRLLTSYPKETLEVFAPHILAQHGEPTGIESVSTEVFNLDPQGRSGMLDIALLSSGASPLRPFGPTPLALSALAFRGYAAVGADGSLRDYIHPPRLGARHHFKL